MEEENSINALTKAGRKYNKLFKNTEKLARAAHQHPEVAYEASSTLNFGSRPQNDLNEAEALADMKVLSYFVSEAWEEAREYFMFEFEGEFESYISRLDGETRYQKNAFNDLNKKYDELEMDLSELDRALSQVLDKTPSDKFESEYALEPHRNPLETNGGKMGAD